MGKVPLMATDKTTVDDIFEMFDYALNGRSVGADNYITNVIENDKDSVVLEISNGQSFLVSVRDVSDKL
jgi:hypothetical protein